MSEPTGTPEPQYTWQLVEPVAPVVKDRRRERRRLSIVVGGAAAFVLVALVSAVALSAPSGAPPALAAGAANPTPTPQAAAPGQLGGRSQACQDMLSNLAARLNISVQTLQQALTGAAGDTIDQLVQQGRLTQTQADQLKSALSNAGSSPCAEGRFGFGVGPFGVGALPFAGGPGHGAWHADATAVLNAAASALKLDAQSLLSSLRSGQDLKAIAQKQGVDYATVTSAIHDAVKTQLDALVTQGTMTSAHETSILNAVDQQLANGHLAFGFGPGFRGMPGGVGMPGGFGGGSGMHGWYGGRGGAAPNTPVSPTPSPTPQAPSSQG